MTAAGRVTISDRAVERIATHALAEVDELGGVARRLLGVSLGEDSAETAPDVHAHVDGQLATLRMTVSVVYPAPVREVIRQARQIITHRVAEYTGLDIRQVDVDVASLVSAAPRGRVT